MLKHLKIFKKPWLHVSVINSYQPHNGMEYIKKLTFNVLQIDNFNENKTNLTESEQPHNECT
jgi:hypothetical protein